MEINELISKQDQFFRNFDNISVPRGGLTLADSEELDYIVKNFTKNSPTLQIADVGCWTGQSTVILAETVKLRRGKVYAIDWFKGSQGTNLDEPASYINIKEIFKSNIQKMECSEYVELVEKTSEEASKDFKDESLDLIFIDADHRYDNVKKDIALWLPKLKKGGILCGHDCEVIINDGINSLLKIFKDKDIIKVLHLGTCLAVGELGGQKIRSLDKFEPQETLLTSIWYYKK